MRGLANGGASPVSPGAGLEDPSVYFDAPEDHAPGDVRPHPYPSHVNNNVRGSSDTANPVRFKTKLECKLFKISCYFLLFTFFLTFNTGELE